MFKFCSFCSRFILGKKKKKSWTVYAKKKKKKKQASKQPTYEGTVLNTDGKANFHSK